MTTPNGKKTIDDNFCYRSDFKYTHDNPYHDKLGVFDSFVLRDEEAESNVGKWNERIFQNPKPVEVEIGTGYGEFMMEYFYHAGGEHSSFYVIFKYNRKLNDWILHETNLTSTSNTPTEDGSYDDTETETKTKKDFGLIRFKDYKGNAY